MVQAQPNLKKVQPKLDQFSDRVKLNQIQPARITSVSVSTNSLFNFSKQFLDKEGRLAGWWKDIGGRVLHGCWHVIKSVLLLKYLVQCTKQRKLLRV